MIINLQNITKVKFQAHKVENELYRQKSLSFKTNSQKSNVNNKILNKPTIFFVLQ